MSATFPERAVLGVSQVDPRRQRRAAPRWAVTVVVGLVATIAPLGQRAPLAATSPVIAKVGSTTITAADLERRMAAVPAFQLKTFGATPNQVRREFLERVLIREALLSQGAAERGLENRDDVKDRMRGVLRSAFLNKLKGDVVATTHIEDADVKAYYEKNAARFHTPERYALWIIVTRKQEEANEVLAELHKDASPKHWTELARAKSIDGATAVRGGNLGFVSPDGTTSEPGMKVGHALVEAAQRLKDAEIASQPVKDGDHWVVVWRKQTMAAVTRSLEVEAGSIRQMLLHMRTDAKVKETIANLRTLHLGDHNADLIDLFDITPQGEMTPVRRPGSLPGSHRVQATPMPSPGGLR